MYFKCLRENFFSPTSAGRPKSVWWLDQWDYLGCFWGWSWWSYRPCSRRWHASWESWSRCPTQRSEWRRKPSIPNTKIKFNFFSNITNLILVNLKIMSYFFWPQLRVLSFWLWTPWTRATRWWGAEWARRGAGRSTARPPPWRPGSIHRTAPLSGCRRQKQSLLH